jgi:hypothetical protein
LCSPDPNHQNQHHSSRQGSLNCIGRKEEGRTRRIGERRRVFAGERISALEFFSASRGGEISVEGRGEEENIGNNAAIESFSSFGCTAARDVAGVLPSPHSTCSICAIFGIL